MYVGVLDLKHILASTRRGGQIEIIFELEPADSNNLIHYTQRSIDQS